MKMLSLEDSFNAKHDSRTINTTTMSDHLQDDATQTANETINYDELIRMNDDDAATNAESSSINNTTSCSNDDEAKNNNESLVNMNNSQVSDETDSRQSMMLLGSGSFKGAVHYLSNPSLVRHKF